MNRAGAGFDPGGPGVSLSMKIANFFTAVFLFAATTHAATLSGVVVTEQNVPIPNLRLTLRASDSRVERETVTDEKGRFVFLGVRAARLYRLTSDWQIRTAIVNVSAGDEIKLHGYVYREWSESCGGIVWVEDIDTQKQMSSYPWRVHTRAYVCL